MAMIDSMGLKLSPNPNYDAYYGLIDFEFWARKNIGDDAVEYLKKNIHPLDLAFRLAEAYGIVLLNGGGFEAPNWSLRVSLANLPDEAYEQIGRGVRLIARGYRDMYRGVKTGPGEVTPSVAKWIAGPAPGFPLGSRLVGVPFVAATPMIPVQ